MNKSLLFITTVALALVLAPARVAGFQTPVSVENAKADARKAAAEADAANRKAANAIDLAIKTSAKEEAHGAAQHIRNDIADARDAGREAAEKTEAAYQKAVVANQGFSSRAKESARTSAAASAEAVDKAEAWFKAAAQSDKAAIEKAASDVRVSLNKAATATKEAIESGNSAAQAAWKKDMAKDTEKK